MPTDDAPLPLSAAELEAMRARCEAATDGPWMVTDPAWRHPPGNLVIGHHTPGSSYNIARVFHSQSISGCTSLAPESAEAEANAELMAAARTDLPRLLDELERCRAIIDDLATEYAPFSGERCPWCERYPSSDNDWWEPRHHTDDCPFVQARAYLRAVRGE